MASPAAGEPPALAADGFRAMPLETAAEEAALPDVGPEGPLPDAWRARFGELSTQDLKAFFLEIFQSQKGSFSEPQRFVLRKDVQE